MPSLEAPLFALNFKTKNSTTADSPSIAFGRIDRAAYTGLLAKTSINRTSNRWSTDNITFTVGGQLMEENASLIFGESFHPACGMKLTLNDRYWWG